MSRLDVVNAAISSAIAYRDAAKEFLTVNDEARLKQLLAVLYEEQRLLLRTVMLVLVKDKPVVVDITDFYDLQILYNNDVDPSILSTVASLMYPNCDTQVLGYSSPVDTEYWNDDMLLLSSDDKQALSDWISVNK